MNRMRKIVTQVLVVLVAFSTLFVATLSVQPKRAEAILGVGDIVEDPANLIQNMMKVLKEYGLDTVITMIGHRIVDKLVDSTKNWAEGGFEGQPSFISNWDDFWLDVKHYSLEQAFNYALQKATTETAQLYSEKSEKSKAAYSECVKTFEEMYSGKKWNDAEKEEAKRRACGKPENFGTTVTHAVSEIAAANYEKYKSSKHLDLRKSVRIVGRYAHESLFGDDYKEAIKQKGPLKTYLDRQGTSEDEFLNDFSVGGWEAYMLQSGDNALVKKSKIINSLSVKIKNKMQSKLNEVRTPNKFLDKLKCKNGTDEYGNCKGDSVVATPASEVDDQEKEALKSDKQQALLVKEISDLFAYSLGRITEEMFSYGMNKLQERLASQWNAESSIFSEYENLNADEYDVLGITNDFASKNKNNLNEEGGGSTFTKLGLSKRENIYTIYAGGDASVPYVGGPEDPRESVELVIDLEKKLNKQLKITKAYLDESVKTRKILNKAVQYVSVLDHCLPGPDLRWEDRYRDKVDWVRNNRFDHQDEEECANAQDAYTEAWLGVNLSTMKEANQDPFLNIPGSDELRTVVNALAGPSTNLSARQLAREISERRRVFSTLYSMKQLIRERLNKIEKVTKIPFHLPLFEDEIQTLVPDTNLSKVLHNLDFFKKEIGKSLLKKKFQDKNIKNNDQGGIENQNNQNSSQDLSNNAESKTNNVNQNFSNEDVVSLSFEEVINSRKEFFKKIFGKENLPSGKDEFQKYLSDLNKPAEDEQLVKIPDLTGVKGMKVKWIISDQELIKILSLPASVLNGVYKPIDSKKIKPGISSQEKGINLKEKKEEYLLEHLNLYLFKEGETPETLVKADKKKAAQLAMDLAWALWRRFTPKKEKARFRYQFHVLETNGKFVSEKQLIEKQIKSTEVANSYKKALDYSSDCKTFVSYVHPKEVRGFRNRVYGKSDREIDQFLEREYKKQQSKKNSIFITDLFTSPAHRKLSILKFKSEDAVKKYYDDMYPDMRDLGKAYSIKEIFAKDKTARTLAEITPKIISSDRTGLMFAAAGLPQVAVAKALFGKPPIQVKADPNYGKRLFCAATGTEYKKGRGSKTWFGSIINTVGGNDKCWNGHSIDLCSSSGDTAGQTWYYARKAVYKSAVAGVN